MRRLDDLLERLGEADDFAALDDAIATLRDEFGMDHVVYHRVRGSGPQWAALTYDPNWVAAYLSEGFQAIDPVVLSCFTRATPVDWKTLNWGARHARTLLGEAVAHGVGNQGLSLPLHGPSGRFALFTINHRANDDAWQRFTEHNLSQVLLAAHYINERAMQLEGHAPPETRALSPRETDALALLAAGHSRARVAEHLSISEHTLRDYIEGARNKLGAANTTHAVAAALSRGLIGL